MAEELEEDRSRRGDGSLPRVDLHGCTLDQARRRLAQELTRWRAGGVTRGRVITGSGFGSPGGKARLAPEVDSWLRGEGRAYGVTEVRPVPGQGAFDVTIER